MTKKKKMLISSRHYWTSLTMIIIVIIKIMIMIIIQCKAHVSPPGCSHAQEDRAFEGQSTGWNHNKDAADMLMCLQEEILITLFYLPGL